MIDKNDYSSTPDRADDVNRLRANEGLRNVDAKDDNIHPVDMPLPDPEEANRRAREIYEQKHSSGENEDKTLQAGEDAFNPTEIKLASDRRDNSRAPRRANEATDPNDTGSGGIPAGGVKSGSSLQ